MRHIVGVPTLVDLERNDLEGALQIYTDAKAKKKLTGDVMRVLMLSFDDSGDALLQAIKDRNL